MATDHEIKSMLKFYSRKSEEPGGGKMFRVFNGPTPLFTAWGRSRADLFNALNRRNVKFTRLLELA